MNIRHAILAAADKIESSPQQYSFLSIGIPDPNNPETRGCALGWIGAYWGLPTEEFGFSSVPALLGMEFDNSTYVFYRRMDEICGEIVGQFVGAESVEFNNTEHWINNADNCAECLRRYAYKYHLLQKAA